MRTRLLVPLFSNPYQNTLSEPDPPPGAGFITSQDGSYVMLLPELADRSWGSLGPPICSFASHHWRSHCTPRRAAGNALFWQKLW